ncbi:MAG: hypothetical protein ACO1PI_04410 [Bacteroidota bacterium]
MDVEEKKLFKLFDIACQITTVGLCIYYNTILIYIMMAGCAWQLISFLVQCPKHGIGNLVYWKIAKVVLISTLIFLISFGIHAIVPTVVSTIFYFFSAMLCVFGCPVAFIIYFITTILEFYKLFTQNET